MTMNKKKGSIRESEDAEFGMDSKYSSGKERLSDGRALMEARLQRMHNISDEQIIRARLLQLKLQMEEFISNPVVEDRNYFTDFLVMYVDALYSKRNNFAKDIDISPVSLSQVLNNHREPKVEFLLRLMIHSEKVYRNISAFEKNTWFQVYYHEKICDTLSRQNQWRPEEEKHVNISEPMQVYGKLLFPQRKE